MNLPASIRFVAWGLLVVAAILAAGFLAPRVRNSESPAPSGSATVPDRPRPGEPSARAASLSSTPIVRPLSDPPALLDLGSAEQVQLVIKHHSESWREGDQAPDLAHLLESWAQRDGAAALDCFTSANHPKPFSRWALTHLVAGWTKADPAAALAWTSPSNRIPSEAPSGLFLTALRCAAQDGDARPALAAAANLPPGGLRTAAADAIAVGVVWGRSVAEAADWYESVSSPLKPSLLRPLARRLVDLDPAETAAWGASLPGRGSRFEAVPEIVRRWSRIDPSEAAAWAWDLPEADLRSDALVEVVREWAPQDAEAAGQWLGTLPSGLETDRALAFYVNDISRTHPEIASQWLALINDSRARHSAALRVNFHWNRVNPAAAARWRSQTRIAAPAP